MHISVCVALASQCVCAGVCVFAAKCVNKNKSLNEKLRKKNEDCYSKHETTHPRSARAGEKDRKRESVDGEAEKCILSQQLSN